MTVQTVPGTMTRWGKHPVHGMSLIYTAVAMAALMGLMSLAVDYGRTQLVKTELQRAADAAARAAANKLDQSITVVRNEAIYWAGLNQADGHSVVLQNSDIEIGNWTNGTFTAGATGNAVRVTATLSSSRSTAVPVLFAQILGRSSCDVRAVSIVTSKPGGYGVVGLDFITMAGNSSDSYWSTSGYSSGNSGAIASNGSITLSGGSYVHGDARPGVGQVVNGAAGRVGGITTPLSTPLSYANGSAGMYAFFNMNGSCPGYAYSGTDFTLGKNKSVTLPGGHYYFHDFSTHTTSTMAFTGAATIYIYGTADIAGQTTTQGSTPGNLTIVMCPAWDGTPPGSLNVTSGADLYATVYAPQSAITLGGSGDIYGSVVGKSVSMTGSSAIHYDLALSGPGGCSIVK